MLPVSWSYAGRLLRYIAPKIISKFLRKTLVLCQCLRGYTPSATMTGARHVNESSPGSFLDYCQRRVSHGYCCPWAPKPCRHCGSARTLPLEHLSLKAGTDSTKMSKTYRMYRCLFSKLFPNTVPLPDLNINICR